MPAWMFLLHSSPHFTPVVTSLLPSTITAMFLKASPSPDPSQANCVPAEAITQMLALSSQLSRFQGDPSPLPPGVLHGPVAGWLPPGALNQAGSHRTCSTMTLGHKPALVFLLHPVAVVPLPHPSLQRGIQYSAGYFECPAPCFLLPIFSSFASLSFFWGPSLSFLFHLCLIHGKLQASLSHVSASASL